MTLEELNTLEDDAAERAFLRCCGSTRWAHDMAARRPYRDARTLIGEGDRIWRALDAQDWREAFAAHPRIGESHAAGQTGRPGRIPPVGEAGEAGGAGQAGDAGETSRAGERNRDWSRDEQAGM